jgi:hypothetical protein
MPSEPLSVRLARLTAGETELLTLEEFNQAFPGHVSDDDQKQAAIELAAAFDCSIRFIGLPDGYASFTRHQLRRGSDL